MLVGIMFKDVIHQSVSGSQTLIPVDSALDCATLGR